MDPLGPIPFGIAGPIEGNYAFLSGIFPTMEDSEKFLASLDSDTRDYVLKHTDEFRTKADIIECINRLHGIH